MNYNNFERLFTLRGAREFSVHKGPEYLAELVLAQQRCWDHVYSSGSGIDEYKSFDSSSNSPDNDSEEDNLPNNLNYDELKKLTKEKLKSYLREKQLRVSGNKN